METFRMTGSSNANREKQDFYPTPPYATIKLLEQETFKGELWEPACGDGAISKILKEWGYTVTSTDLYERGYGIGGIDFLQTEHKAENIITNPPYKLAQDFVEKALQATSGKTAMLLKLNFLEGQRRHDFFKSTPLKTVYVFSKRISFDNGTTKGGNKGLLAYAWFLWENGYRGRPTIEWLI